MAEFTESLPNSMRNDYYDYRVQLGRDAVKGMGAHEALKYWSIKGYSPDFSLLGHRDVEAAWNAVPAQNQSAEYLAPVIPIFSERQDYETGLAAAGN